MIANNINGVIKVFNSIPKRWGNTFNYDKLDNSIHYADGFKEMVIPSITSIQKLGEVYLDVDNDVYTNYILNKTQEELDADAQALIDQPINDEFFKYQLRQQDGTNRYLILSAEFRLLKLNEDITDAFHILIEDKLKPVRDELVNGQFITSKRLLEEIGSSVIGQVTYDRFHLSLTLAIAEHY